MGHGAPLSLLPLALPERPADRAFTLQYTTLILIIITFVVGAFGGHRRGESPTESPRTEGLVAPSAVEVSGGERDEGRLPSDTIKIEHLFKAASVELDPAKAGALAAVLKAHDIDAEIDIVADSMGEDDYRLALRQGRALLRHLLDAGVPAPFFRVFIVDSRIPEWAASEIESATTVRLYRGGTGE